MHGEEHNRRTKRLPILYHNHQIFKGSQFNPAHAESFWHQRKNHAPKLVPGIAQCHNDHTPRNERAVDWQPRSIAIFLPRAFWHGTIVAAVAGTLQQAIEVGLNLEFRALELILARPS